jgi:general secretion pathway protein F
MPRFRYRALRQSGGEVSGELVADDERGAATQLQSLGSLPIEIAPAAARRAIRTPRLAWGARLSSRELVLFTNQLAALASAGVTLDRALALMAAERGHARRAGLAERVRAAVERGETLSRALADEPSFPRPHAMMIAAGEARGDIAGALGRLAAVLERNRAVGQALASALIYPASVLVVACVSIAFLLGFVVPRFAVLLESFRHEPPLAMRLLLGASDVIQSWGLPALVAVAALAVFYVVRRRDAGFRAAVGRRLLALPGLGRVIAQVESERLLVLLGHMVAAGVALPAAVAAARDSSGNAAVREGLAEAGRRIERGERVTAALASAGLMPQLALELVRVGEETGDLAPMLLKAGDILRKEIEAASNEWLAIVGPLSMVVLGLIIGAIALALFSTVLEVYDIAS